MKPAPFRYVAPESSAEVLQILRDNAPDARVLAGGHSMILLMNLRMSRPSVVVDLQRIRHLHEFKLSGDHVEIGAMVRQRVLERDQVLRTSFPLLAEAIEHVGHVATRSRGTVVGSLCNADPAAELPVCAVALDAQIELHSVDGVRHLSAEEFFDDAFATNAEPDELVTKVNFPKMRGFTGYSFDEIARRHRDFALVATACFVTMDHSERIHDVRLVLGGVAGRPTRVPEAEAALKGQQPATELFRHASQLICERIEPESDLHGSGSYRRAIVQVLVERSLVTATGRSSQAIRDR